MNSCSVTIEWLKALATPAIAVAGIVIAVAQLRIANVRLTHGLFDRRYAVYAATRKFIRQICQNRTITIEELSSFYYASGDAIFVLDQGLAKYLELLRTKAVRTAELHDKIGNQATQAEIKEHWDLLNWFSIQIDLLTKKFKPFLQYSRFLVSKAEDRRLCGIGSRFARGRGRGRERVVATYGHGGFPSPVRVRRVRRENSR